MFIKEILKIVHRGLAAAADLFITILLFIFLLILCIFPLLLDEDFLMDIISGDIHDKILLNVDKDEKSNNTLPITYSTTRLP